MTEAAPERTQEMIVNGQVWVGMNYPDGTHGWEIRGTGVILDLPFATATDLVEAKPCHCSVERDWNEPHIPAQDCPQHGDVRLFADMLEQSEAKSARRLAEVKHLAGIIRRQRWHAGKEGKAHKRTKDYLDAVKELHRPTTNLGRYDWDGWFVAICQEGCRDHHGNDAVWPCDTARAFGVTYDERVRLHEASS